MVTIERSGGGLTVRCITRQPLVYLDQWAVSMLAAKPDLQHRFLEIFKTKGTLMFSWMNVAEISTITGDNSARTRDFLRRIGADWFPLESNIHDVIAREPLTVGLDSPCFDADFLREYIPHVYEGPLDLGSVVTLVDGQAEEAKAQLAGLKATVANGIRALRAKEKANPGFAMKQFPGNSFQPDRPAQFFHDELFRSMVLDKSWTLSDNDAIDLYHCASAVAYSDVALLDKRWALLVRRMPTPPNRIRTYYVDELSEFFAFFEQSKLAGAV